MQDARMQNFEISEIKSADDGYPELLGEIQSPPSTIYVRGKLPDKDKLCVAIVGTRKASMEGLRIARETAAELARCGICIVSGLALGIDASAHEGALDGNGITVAVLGNGIDSIYPKQNERVAKRILSGGGAIVSEYAPGAPTFPGNFIARNRIISGLSAAVIVIEAPEHSGAVATAGFAAEQGRTVFVFPGAARNPQYAGSHGLIRDGAILATSARDILDDLGVGVETEAERFTPDLYSHTDNERAVLDAIRGYGKPMPLDAIGASANLPARDVSRSITTLILNMSVIETEKGYIPNDRAGNSRKI